MGIVLLTSANPRALYRPVNRILQAAAVLRLWHLASFDAPTVAIAWSLGFAMAAKVQLPIWSPVLIALVVWSVYVGDRLLDARGALLSKQIHHLRQRHLFHWRHRRVLIPLALVAAFTAACIVFSCMPVAARARNSLLAMAAAAYFSNIHSPNKLLPKMPKELWVAVLFTVGCALPTLGRAERASVILLPILVFFAALAWLNCFAIERWESAARICPDLQIRSRAVFLALAGLVAAFVLFAFQPRAAVLLVAGSVSALLLGLLDRCRNRLNPLDLRLAADLVLLTPLALLFR